MLKQTRAQLDIDPLRGVRQEIVAQSREHRLEQRHAGQRDQHYHKRALRAMGQYLVDDDLERQRRHQGEYLDKEGREQNMRQLGLVFADGVPEPPHIELGRGSPACGVGRRSHRGDARTRFDPCTGEVRRKLGRRHGDGLRAGALHQHRVADPAHQDQFTAGGRCKHGQRRVGQRGQRAADALGCEAEILQAPQHAVGIEVVGNIPPPRERFGISTPLMQRGKRRQHG
ncbi:hypothetical protein D9M68_629120 [compost metagenome]